MTPIETTPAKRGRPRKVSPDAQPQDDVRMTVRVLHYKIFTSQGRFIAGEKADLPVTEAVDLIATGLAKKC